MNNTFHFHFEENTKIRTMSDQVHQTSNTRRVGPDTESSSSSSLSDNANGRSSYDAQYENNRNLGRQENNDSARTWRRQPNSRRSDGSSSSYITANEDTPTHAEDRRPSAFRRQLPSAAPRFERPAERTSARDFHRFTVPNRRRDRSISDSEAEVESSRRRRSVHVHGRSAEVSGNFSDSEASSNQSRRRRKAVNIETESAPRHFRRDQRFSHRNIRPFPYTQAVGQRHRVADRRIINSNSFSGLVVTNSSSVDSGISGINHHILRDVVTGSDNSDVHLNAFSGHRITDSHNINTGIAGFNHNIKF